MVLAVQDEQAESKHQENRDGIQQQQELGGPHQQPLPGGFILVHMEDQAAQGKDGIARNGVKRPVIAVKDPDRTDIEDGQQRGKQEPGCFMFISCHMDHSPVYSRWSIMRISSAQATSTKINSSSR